ncbi:MAG: AraC family transcriptional regulator [Proteobacteria bacterium]|nr:AraC family transcriptional regulator [Pseudomonadota bacterium]
MGDAIHIRSSTTLPPSRLINSVVVMARIAARYGIGMTTFLEGSGILPEDLEDPGKLITIMQEKTLSRRLMALSKVPWIGLEVGQDYHFSANGKLGMAMMCCDTLLDALKLVLAYIPLTGSYHQYNLRIEGKTGYARFSELMDLEELQRFCCEGVLASIHTMVRLSNIESRVFNELYFAYPRPSYAEKYEELFQCPIIFNAPSHMIIFDASHLSKPMTLANPLMKRTFEKDCHQQLPLLQEHVSVTARIRQELATHLEGFPTFTQMASRINLSPRTLRRRLLDERTSYKTILSDIRRSKAMELLRTTSLSMENVSNRLGFCEVSSFYRAFKGWTGSTPNSYRAKDL